jgi:hypothetical protein
MINPLQNSASIWILLFTLAGPFCTILGRFRTNTKMITITNTSSLCGYVRPNHDIISHHFVQTSSWHSKRTWFCWFASISGYFPLSNAILFDYLKKNLWRVHYRIRTGAKPPYLCVLRCLCYKTCFHLFSGVWSAKRLKKLWSQVILSWS